MKTLYLSLILVVCSFYNSFASDSLKVVEQEKGYITVSGKNNWFISIGGGVQVYSGTQDLDLFSEDNLGIAVDFSFGRWVAPSYGFRVQLSGFEAHGWSKTLTPWATEKQSGIYYLEKFYFANAHIDMLWNPLDMGDNYRFARVFKIIPFFGAGAVSTFDDTFKPLFSPSVSAGLIFNFRLSKVLSLNTELRSSLFDGRMDKVASFPDIESMNTATISLQFDINSKRLQRKDEIATSFKYEIEGLKREMDRVNKLYSETDSKNKELNSRYYKIMRENDSILSAPKDTVFKVVEKQVYSKAQSTVVSVSDFAVFFTNASSEISSKDKINLKYLSNTIRASKGTIFTVTPYSDNRTGSPSSNKNLAKKRGQAVIDYLIRCGVNKANLRLEYNEFNDVPFNDPNLNRVVIIRAFSK